MFNVIPIINNVTGFLKNLNLSKKDIVIIFCVLGIAATSWSASHYRGKSNRLGLVLKAAQKKLHIERNKEKLEDNIDWVKKLKKDNKELDKNLQDLWIAYDALNSVSLGSHMQRLKDVKTANEICEEFEKIGYKCSPINIEKCDGNS